MKFKRNPENTVNTVLKIKKCSVASSYNPFFCTNCSVHCYWRQNLSSDGWHTHKTEQVTFIVRKNSITGEPTEHVSNKAIDSDGKTVIVLSPSKQSHYNINKMMNKKDTWAVSCMQLIIWPSHSERNNENLLKIHK